MTSQNITMDHRSVLTSFIFMVTLLKILKIFYNTYQNYLYDFYKLKKRV